MANPFNVHRRDTGTVLGLLVIAVAVVVFVFYDTPDYEDDIGVAPQSSRRSAAPYSTAPQPAATLRPFDPNTADSTALLALGLAPWQVRAIYHYRAKGGVYMHPEDFARLPGLTVKKYRELRPYIRIGADYRPAADVYRREPRGYERREAPAAIYDSLRPRKLAATEAILLNHADTLELRRVPGIGPTYARRIARYRERLGGFVRREQLLEIEDFPESALPYLHIQAGEPVRRLNINRATAEQLRKHPYIDYHMARQVMDYRRVRGRINDLDDLRLLPTFTAERIERLRPYIEY